MDSAADLPPVIALPERLDRRMRLGPFPSSRDALKFVAYASAGALLSPFTSPWLCLPVVALGFLCSVWRPDGEAIDERAWNFVAWKLRAAGAGLLDMSASPLVRQGLLQLPSHRYVAVVRAGGVPFAYLPPEELGRRFEVYREILRSTDSSFGWMATTSPIHAQRVRPGSLPANPSEVGAASGYSELVTLLCRHRSLRRVYFVLGSTEAGTEAIGHLEGRVAHLVEQLGCLGLRPVRLRDRSLAEAARRFGWPTDAGGG